MTVDIIGSVEMHTFTDAELATIKDALRIADAHYMELAQIAPRAEPEFRRILEQQARDAAELQLKIEAGR